MTASVINTVKCVTFSSKHVQHDSSNFYKTVLLSESEKWKWSYIRPSMVTHTRNLCSAINPSKVHTHSSEHTNTHIHTHTVNTHLEQWAAIYAAVSREQLGFRRLAQAHLSRGIESRESAVVHSAPPPPPPPPPPTILAGLRFELATFGSDSLTIRPRLPYNISKN